MFEAVLQQLSPFAQEFERRGKKLYLVGGAVRNLLLNRPATDFDFTTDALPSEVQSYFRKVLPTGLQHGTVTVLFHGNPYEVTTFRVDGGYADGRRPDSVTYTPSLEEDLKRRDFTINALALNLADGRLADFHGGREDLKNRLLRTVGNPAQRFQEDSLRLLRLFRFSSQLGFDIDPATLAAVAPLRARLSLVSRERIRDELRKALAGAEPVRAWVPLQDLGFLRDLFPLLALRSLSGSELAVLASLAPALRWAYWLTGACPQRGAWEESLRSLTFSNVQIGEVLGPCRALDFTAEADSAKAVIEAWGSRERVPLGVEYLRAVNAAGWWNDGGLVGEIERVASAGEPVFLNELALHGRDLIGEGFASGPALGQTLRKLQALVWADPVRNTAEALKAALASMR